MKKNLFLLSLPLLTLLGACSSTYHAGTAAPDDVYYSSKNDAQQPASASQPAQNYSTPSSGNPSQYNTYPSGNTTGNGNPSDQGYYDNASSSPGNSGYSTQDAAGADYSNPNSSTSDYASSGNGTSYVTNNYYYSQDDYYDYAYTARMRRFYSPYNGYSYYDPVYTNSYWYDNNPVNWGVSIYTGYNWWAPSYYYYSPFIYNSGITLGINIGWGGSCYSNWNYPAYYSPWSFGCGSFGFGWGHHGYGHGYANGYNNGYWAGYNQGYYDGSWGLSNPYYYNSYDGNFHYGPRGASAGGNTPRPNASHSYGSGKTVSSVGDKYNIALDQGKVTRPTGSFTTTPVSGKAPDLNEVRPSAKPAFNQQGDGVKNSMNGTTPSGIRPSTNGSSDVRTNNTPSLDPSRNTSGFGRGTTIPEKNQTTVPSRGNTFQGQDPARNNNATFDQSRPQTRPQETTPGRNNTSSPSRGFNQTPSRPYDNRPQEPVRNNPAQEPGRNNDGGRNSMQSRPGNEPAPSRSNEQWRSNDRPAPSYSSPSKSFSQPAPERNSTRPSMEMPRSRDEQRGPTFQPRNEPKQFSQPGRKR